MPVTDLDKTAESLGVPLTNTRTPRTNEFSAVHLERIKDALIEHADALNAGGAGGDVTGPAGATDNALARFDLATGKLLQNSTATLTDAGALAVTEISTGLMLRALASYTGSAPNRYGLLEQVTAVAGGTHAVYVAEVSPEGLITAEPGSLCLVAYPAANANDGVWAKQSGTGNTGWVQVGSGGGVTGPGSSTDNAIPRFDGTGGGTLQGSGVVVDDSDNLDVPGQVTAGAGLALTGAVTQAASTVGVAPNRYATLTVATALGTIGIITAEVTPEGLITVGPGAICLVQYPAPNANDGLWVKATGTGNTGWIRLAAGDVVGPASVADNAVATFDGTSGKLVQAAAVEISSDGTYTSVEGTNAAEILRLKAAQAQSAVLVGGDGTGGAAGGSAIIEGGSSGGAGAGSVDIGTAQASAVNIGRTGITTTIEGTLVSRPLAPITESGTTRTLASSDHGQTILCTHASGCAVTVPHTLSPGFQCFVRRRGGAVTFAGSGGLTVTPPAGFTAGLNGAGSGGSIYVESATVAALDGDLTS